MHLGFKGLSGVIVNYTTISLKVDRQSCRLKLSPPISKPLDSAEAAFEAWFVVILRPRIHVSHSGFDAESPQNEKKNAAV